VDKDVTGSLLASRAKALGSSIVVEANADVEGHRIHGERDGGPLLVGAGLKQLEHWCGVLLSDDTPDRELAYARGQLDTPYDLQQGAVCLTATVMDCTGYMDVKVAAVA
jgi:hypothetical protein